MDLPLGLLEQYQKGRVLVFIGQGINGPEWTRLGQELTSRLGAEEVSGARTTEEMMELYESIYGRQALVQFVLDFYDQAGGPGNVHDLLTRLANCRFFVTTCVDERLEDSFRSAGRPLHSIIRRTDLAYSTAYTARLYRLYGALSQPDSLHLTQEETADALSLLQDEGFSDVLKGHLADSTIVFIGYNLDDAFFKQLYRTSIKPLHRHNPRSFAFAEQDYTELTRWFCQQNNIEILKASLSDILVAFVQTLEKQGVLSQSDEPQKKDLKIEALRQQPYKRLFSYQPEDRSIFFGRQQESEQLLALVHANQLVVLCGDSGVGKSSLLGAGLTPLLEAGDYIVVRERVLEPPLSVLRRSLAGRLSEMPADDSLASLLVAATRQRSLVIILDQFEEFFARLDTTERAIFTRELALVLSRHNLPVKWVLSLRSESLARLNELRPAIPDIFKAEFYLSPLNRDATAQAISGPLSIVGMGMEKELLQSLVTDLGVEGWVEPPQLQVVCYELYQIALAKGDTTLRLEHYQERGGMEEILGSYLEKTLRRLPSPQDTLARQILISLIGAEGVPAMLSLEEIARESHLTTSDASELLTRLQDERLVKTTSHEGKIVYELAHAYLAAGLAMDPELLQRKAMQELLHRGVQDWQHYHILMSQEELRTLQSWVERIDLSADDQKLLLRSSIQRNHDLPYWLGRVEQDIIQSLLKEFISGSEAIKAQPEIALAALASVPQREPYIDDLCNLLKESSLSFPSRKQAALYLAEMNPAMTLKILRDGSDQMNKENQQVIVALYNAEATGQIHLGEDAAWTERIAILFSRLRTNTGYILARTGAAGLAAMIGGLFGSVAGISLIQGEYFFYLFGAAFVPLIWAVGLTLGMTLTESLRLNQSLGTRLVGAILGGLPMVVLAASDYNPDIARRGFIFGLLGAILSGSILSVTLALAEKIRGGVNTIFSVAGAAISGLAYSLVLLPMVGTTDIPGFNQWSLIGILAGGSASMMLGLLLIPSPSFAAANASKW